MYKLFPDRPIVKYLPFAESIDNIDIFQGNFDIFYKLRYICCQYLLKIILWFMMMIIRHFYDFYQFLN